MEHDPAQATSVGPFDLPCGCRKSPRGEWLCQYHEGYEDGFADGMECVCDETSSRNCPVHQNDGSKIPEEGPEGETRRKAEAPSSPETPSSGPDQFDGTSEEA